MRQLLGLSLPIMGGMLSSIGTLIVDGVMCAHLPDGGLSLTAIGFAVQVWFLLEAAQAGLAAGTMAVISRAHGARDLERTNRSLTQSAQLSLLIGGVIAIIGATLGGPLLRALGASREVSEAGASYLQFLMIGFPLTFLFEGSLAVACRAAGNSRLPFLCSLAGDASNVAFNYAFIFGHLGMPAMGIAGAGLGTSLSRVVGLGLLIVAIRRGGVEGLVFRPRLTVVDRSAAGQILRVGIPASLEKLSFYGAMIALVWMLAQISQDAVAAHGIGLRLASLLLVPVFGISIATSALVGNALGAGSVERAREILGLACRTVVVIMSLLAIAIYASIVWILAIYDVDPSSPLEPYAVVWLKLIALTLVPQGLVLLFEGLLLGAGASRTVLGINLATNVVFRTPLAAVLGLWTSLTAFGVWLSWPITIVVQLAVLYAAYRRGRWAQTGVRVAE